MKLQGGWLVLVVGVAVGILYACGTSSPTPTPDGGIPDGGTSPTPDSGNVAPDSGGAPDSGTPDDAGSTPPDAGSAVDAGSAPDAGGTPDSGTPDAGPTTVVLTVKNYLAWCSVTANGGTASTSAAQTVTVPAGATVPLAAVALSGFQLGAAPWHDTSGDTGSGDPGTVTGTGQSASSATHVVVGSTAACVWVCCEFSGGGGCPSGNQCP